jgi:hypothetical protein
MPATNDGIQASVEAIQNMEAACARFARVVVERLPEVERELRQVTEALEDRRTSLLREISTLHEQIFSAEEDDDVSWERQRLEEAEDELASTQQRIRRLSEASANHAAQVRKVEKLATDHTIRSREFLNGAADDLKAYLAKSIEGGSGETGTILTNSPDRYLGGLTSEEEQALRNYTAGENYELNFILRKGYVDDVVLQRLKPIRQALAKLPAYHGVVYHKTIRSMDQLSEYTPGYVVSQKQFTSSSTRLEVAQEFEGNVLFIIKSKTGKLIANISEYAYEDEVLFDIGSTFKVLSREFVSGVCHIELEEL